MQWRSALSKRSGDIARQSRETRLRARVKLDGRGRVKVATGVAFLDHMVEQAARYSGVDLTLQGSGDVRGGRPRHDRAEATFKPLGLALRAAMTAGPGPGVPSSKGLLG